jgi:TRAP-type C4-dicarboxylate transport system permease small subunit
MSNHLRNPSSLSGLKYTARRWCALVALISILAFVALVSVSATHYHTTTQETQECSICNVVSHKIGGGFVVPTLALTQFFILFALATAILRSTLVTTALPLPPSCGPPSIS